MKTSQISLILVTALLFGCANPSPKVSMTDKTDAWAMFFPPNETPIQLGQFSSSQFKEFSSFFGVVTNNGDTLDQFPSSYEPVSNPAPIVYVIVGSPAPPPNVLPLVDPLVDYRRRDMSLIDTTPMPPIDLK